jgi:hypothetical protein
MKQGKGFLLLKYVGRRGKVSFWCSRKRVMFHESGERFLKLTCEAGKRFPPAEE